MKTHHIIPALLVVLMGGNFSVQAQNEKLKTAIIFQFTRLIEWCPAGKQGNFTIGVYCDNKTLFDELSLLQGRTVANQIIDVKQITSPNDLGSVNIALVSRFKIHDLPTIITRVGSNCTLIIADQPGAVKEGAGISFIEVNGSLKFDINKAYAERHSLTLSNDLMKMANSVY
jgi:hypothetical protein